MTPAAKALLSLVELGALYNGRYNQRKPGAVLLRHPHLAEAVRSLVAADVQNVPHWLGLSHAAPARHGRFSLELRRCSIPGCGFLRPVKGKDGDSSETCGRHNR